MWHNGCAILYPDNDANSCILPLLLQFAIFTPTFRGKITYSNLLLLKSYQDLTALVLILRSGHHAFGRRNPH